MVAPPDEKLDDANVTRIAESHGAIMASGETSGWQAWFDGTALPNPGRLGLGAVLLSPAGERRELSRPAGLAGCNNEAELLALIAVLELARELGARRMTLYGDSDFAIRAGRHDAVGPVTQLPRLLPLVARLIELLRSFEVAALVWVPRHRNGDADRLARQALGLPHKAAPVPTGRKRRRGRP